MEGQIKDYIDINMLQKLQDTFSNLTGMSAVTYCDNGYITRLSNPSEFAATYSKDSALGGEGNIENVKSSSSGRANVYVTKSGLTEMSVSISIKGEEIATIVGGQVCEETLADSKIARICNDLGVKAEDFKKALSLVPVKSRADITAAADFLTLISQIITSGVGKKSERVSKVEKTFDGDNDSPQGMLHQKLVQIDELVGEMLNNNKKLYDNFEGLSNAASNSVKKLGDTKETVKSIQDIAMNTRILGFNASIEASRAKESGKGFGVIAQEVRSLADVSKSSTDKIENFIQELGENTEEISSGLQKTEGMLRTNIDDADTIATLLGEVSELSNQIK